MGVLRRDRDADFYYFKNYRLPSPLSREALKMFFEKIRNGDVAARETVILANLGLVIWIAKWYFKYSRKNRCAISDIIHAGIVGLIKAVDAFDHRKGARFSTYATYWIRHCILSFLQPHYISNKIFAYARYKQHEAQLGRRPTISELAKSLRVSVDKVQFAEHLLNGFASLPYGKKGHGRNNQKEDQPVSAFLRPDEEAEQTDDQEVLKSKISKSLQVLSARNQMIFKMYHGLDDIQPMTMAAIGEKLNLSAERVRQILEESLRIIKPELKKIYHNISH